MSLVAARSVRLHLEQPVSVKAFGATGDGITDDTAALQAALTAGVPLHMPKGTYLVTSKLTAPGSLSLFGEGADSVIDASSIAGTALEVAGSLVALPGLGSAASGASIAFASAPTLAQGDLICVWNPTESSLSAFRTNYFAGEFAEVESVDGSTVTLTGRLHATYAVADVNLYRVAAPTLTLRDFTLLGAAQVTLARDVRITRVDVQATVASALAVARSFGVRITDCVVFNDGIDTGLDYGIAISNSQHVRISGSDIFGRRHSVATGGGTDTGAVPCRDVVVDGCTLKNSVDVHNADFHGNTIGSLYTNCTIYGGASLQGRDNAYVNNVIHGMLTSGACLYAGEMVGGTHRFIGNRLFTHTDPNASGRGVVDFGGNSSAITANSGDLTIIVRDNALESAALGASTSFLLVANRGSTSKLNVICEDNVLLVNDLANVARVRLISGTAARDFVTASGNLANVSATELNADVGYA